MTASLIGPPRLDDCSSSTIEHDIMRLVREWMAGGRLPAGLHVDLASSMKGLTSSTPLDFLDRPHGWITSSARASAAGGMVRPSTLADFKLRTSARLVGCSMGRSASFAPFSTLPANTPPRGRHVNEAWPKAQANTRHLTILEHTSLEGALVPQDPRSAPDETKSRARAIRCHLDAIGRHWRKR